MFAALLEDAPPPPVPVAAAEPVAVVAVAAPLVGHRGRGRGGRGRGLGGGGRGGTRHSEQSKLHISQSLLKRHRDKLKDKLRQAAIPRDQSLAAEVFGVAGAGADNQAKARRRESFAFRVGEVVGVAPCDQRHTLNDDVHRGAVSFVEGQAEVVNEQMSNDNVAGAVQQLVFDDAAMWIRGRPDETKTKLIDMQVKAMEMRGVSPDKIRKHTLKEKSKGRHRHATVLNMCEQLFLLDQITGGPTVATEIHSPSITLPSANFSTVCKRLEDWSFVAGALTGRTTRIDPLGRARDS